MISAAIGLLWIGGLVGTAVTAFVADNFGRKLTVILGLSASLAGCLVTIFAGSLLMAEMGNFFLGFGIQGLFGPMICIL